VDAVPVEVVLETTSACPDRARAQAALADALAGARAPKRGGPANTWLVRLGVDNESKNETKIKKATARIIDDRGATVAERTVDDRAACTPLARALGAWAALVLDDELARARDAADAPLPAPAPVREEKSFAPVTLDRADWRSPQDPDYVPPETTKPWTLELGLMGYLRDGLTSATGFAGGAAFAAFEVSPGLFVRPAFYYGTSTTLVAAESTSERAPATHIGGRGDLCKRIPGNYIERRGLELDLCFGGDLSAVNARDNTVARSSIGPSGAFRGEIGSNANLELRLVSGFNFIRESLVREERLPMIFAQAEVGVSWRFR
jgi:hypothetical protein